MRNRVGINEMAASGSAKSGMPAQLAALMEAQTQQLHAGLGAGYARLVVRSRTSLLRLLKRFAHSTRVAQIAGKSGDWQLREWSASDLEPMDRVSGEPVNPSMRNFAGRMQVADTLLQHGAINPRQYLTLYTTGRLDSTWEFEAANLARVQRDKELLREGVGLPPVDAAASMQAGEPVFADDGRPHVLPLLTDTHWVDIPEALGVLATPEARGNPEVAKAVTEVVRRRLELYRQMPLELRVMLGDPHLEALAPAAPPPAPPMKPEGAAGAVEQPAPPPDPITGEQAAPPLKS
jgi:hypothetical protein